MPDLPYFEISTRVKLPFVSGAPEISLQAAARLSPVAVRAAPRCVFDVLHAANAALSTNRGHAQGVHGAQTGPNAGPPPSLGTKQGAPSGMLLAPVEPEGSSPASDARLGTPFSGWRAPENGPSAGSLDRQDSSWRLIHLAHVVSLLTLHNLAATPRSASPTWSWPSFRT
jgi:hypothetical protein